MQKPIIASIGEILWDVFEDGSKTLGGAPLNCLYNAIRCGAEGYFISAVGKDDFGLFLKNLLPKTGVIYLIEENEYPTGVVDVKLKDALPSYTIREKSAWDYISYSDEISKVSKNIDALCFGTLACRNYKSRNTILKFIQSVPQSAVKFFDMNLRSPYYSKELIETLLELSDILKLNGEELQIISPMFDLSSNEDEACAFLMKKYNLSHIALTCSGDYSATYCINSKSFIKTPKIKVVDTIGAGDAFAGTFLGNLLMGAGLAVSHKAAVAEAAKVCSQKGALPPFSL